MTTIEALRTLLDPHVAVASLRSLRGQLRDIASLLAANVLKVGLGVVTSALVFRALGPNDVGRLTLTLGVIGVLAIVSEFGLRDAAVKYIAQFRSSAPERAHAVAHSYLVAKITLSTLASAVGIVAAGAIAARFYPDARVADLIRLGAFSLFSSGLLSFSLVILEATQEFGAISKVHAIQTLVRALLIVVLYAAADVTLIALLVLEAAIPLTMFFYSLRSVPRAFYRVRRLLDRASWRMLGQHAAMLFHFSKWIAVAAVASMIVARLDVLLLSYYWRPAEVGIYAAALAIVNRLNVLKQPVLTTSFPDACRRVDRPDLRAYVGRSLKLTGFLSLTVLPLFGVGGFVIELLYGATFGSAAPALYVLLVAFLIGLNVEPVAYVLYPLDRPEWVAINDVLQLGAFCLVGLFLIPRFGLVGAALSTVLVRGLSAVFVAWLVYRFLGK